MSDVSSVTSHFSTSNEGFTTTLGSPITAGATTVPLSSTTNLTNGSIFVGIIEPSGSKQQVFTGVVSTGTTSITSVVWTRGTNVDHSAGVTIVDYVTGTDHNMMTKGILVEHNQDGTHKTAAATTLKTTLLGYVYPVGSIYINATSSTNPSSLLGFGTWTAFGAGRVPVGVGTSDQTFAAAATGGESTHTLTIPEMPSHTHTFTTPLNAGDTDRGSSSSFWSIDNAVTGTTSSTGGGGSHNNLQPYIVVYMWQRTA